MKLNADTVKILENFSGINKNLAIKEGNVLETISAGKTVWAKATISQSFPSEFAIFDLSRLLGVISMFGDADVEIMDKYLKISNGKQSIKYYFTPANLIVSPPKKEIALPPEGLISFDLDQASFDTVNKAMKVLQFEEMAVVGEEGKIYLKAVDAEKASNDEFKVAVGETSDEFNMIFKKKNLDTLLPGDYKVSISPKGLAKFERENLSYFVAVEATSTAS